MSKKCQKCQKYLKNNRGYSIHYERMHGKRRVVDDDVLQEILNRVRKLELDNSFLKTQLKHKVSTTKSKDSELNWTLPKKVQVVKNESEIQFGNVVNELKVMFESNEPVLLKGFRFSDSELGISVVSQLQMVIV